MKETTCYVFGVNYKLEYHRISSEDGFMIYEGVLFQNPPLIFSYTISENNRIKFSPLQTALSIQDAIKMAVEKTEEQIIKGYC